MSGRRIVAAFLLAGLSMPAAAHSYRVVLAPPAPGQKMLVGHAGVQAIDERTRGALVRLISPGAEMSKLGTIRVLVMNLGNAPFDFGPDQVTLRLGDGTLIRQAELNQFIKSKELVEQESHRVSIIDRQNRNNIESLAQQSGGGLSGAPAAPGSGPGTMAAPANVATAGADRRQDDDMAFGSTELNAINQILDSPYRVGPRQAWGGYYVFDVPKSVLERQADQPLTILVNTGKEQHRFAAMLKWK